MPQHLRNATKKMSNGLLPVLCGLMVFTSLLCAARSAHGAASPESRVAFTVLGIISYTHWPESKATLRVCLPGGDNPNAANIRTVVDKVNLGRKIVVRTTPTDPVGTCDVVYFPAMSIGEAGQALRPLGGTPVLTIGEGGAFCSAGGMFCLLLGDGGAADDASGFAVNLDATSRSTLRIDPQVLRLSRRNAGGKK